jgi:hypothetical protein
VHVEWLVRYRWQNQQGVALRKGGRSRRTRCTVAMRTHGKLSVLRSRHRGRRASGRKLTRDSRPSARDRAVQLRREGAHLFNAFSKTAHGAAIAEHLGVSSRWTAARDLATAAA